VFLKEQVRNMVDFSFMYDHRPWSGRVRLVDFNGKTVIFLHIYIFSIIHVTRLNFCDKVCVQVKDLSSECFRFAVKVSRYFPLQDQQVAIAYCMFGSSEKYIENPHPSQDLRRGCHTVTDNHSATTCAKHLSQLIHSHLWKRTQE